MKTRLLSPEEIEEAARWIREGWPVAMPTETVYGLAADALNPTAIGRVYAAKARPAEDPLIVHVTQRFANGMGLFEGLIERGLVSSSISPEALHTAKRLADAFWPGPLTLIVPRGASIPAEVSSGLPTVALRMPAHPLAQALIDHSATPLVAPSANKFGRISPTAASAAFDELQGDIPAVLDGGPCAVGVESSIVRILDSGKICALRPGRVTPAHLAELLGEKALVPAPEDNAKVKIAPGLMDSHYAPRAPFALVDAPPSRWSEPRITDILERTTAASIVFLSWSSLTPQDHNVLNQRFGERLQTKVLSAIGSPEEVARRLYQSMRSADAERPGLIIAQAPPGKDGLEKAIADRLNRAAHGTPPLAR